MISRTIPTRVGRTSLPAAGAHAGTDHPHARGENPNCGGNTVNSCGPSPRAWGEPMMHKNRFGTERTIPTRVGRTPSRLRARLEVRTIPTRVGRTNSPATALSVIADHPHARGENRARIGSRERIDGPSPRAWGEPAQCPAVAVARRTIPTRVGRTSSSASSQSLRSDHPHARGENIGVSLRVSYVADHPHAGGENAMKPVTLPRKSGPSPRGWGEPSRYGDEGVHGRTIPTRVGRH